MSKTKNKKLISVYVPNRVTMFLDLLTDLNKGKQSDTVSRCIMFVADSYGLSEAVYKSDKEGIKKSLTEIYRMLISPSWIEEQKDLDDVVNILMERGK
jgi:hypothetical protein